MHRQPEASIGRFARTAAIPARVRRAPAMGGSTLRRLRNFAIAVLFVVGASASQAVFAGSDAVVGINFTHPLKMSTEDQDATIDKLQAAGVKVIRIGTYASELDKAVDFMKRVNAKHIKVLLTVHSVYPPDAPVRATSKDFPGMWQGSPLSSADPALSGKYFQQLLDALDSNGIALSALELENEINHPAFNAEFPLPGEGKNFTADDLSHDPVGQKIGKGYLRYLEILKLLKQTRDHSKLNQHAPLISAGLSDTGPEGPWQKKFDAAGIGATIQFMRANGLDQLVDGYGIHTYPWSNSPGDHAAAVHRLRRMETEDLSECHKSGGRPCWITEWGFQNKDKACPLNDGARTALVSEMMGDFRDLVRQGSVSAVIYYTWSGDGSWDVYRCGEFSDAGKEAIKPL